MPTMRITEKEIETAGEHSKSLCVDLPIVKPSLENKYSKKETEKMELAPETTEMKYNALLKLLIDKDLAVFGIEDFVYDRLLEKDFDQSIGTIEKEFRYS